MNPEHTTTARVLVLTDQPVIGAGVCAVLAGRADVVRGTVADLAGVGTSIDAVVVDTLLFRPGQVADELARALRDTGAAALALTRDLRPGLTDRAISAGVRAFTSLHAPDDELRRAVAAVVVAGSPRGTALPDHLRTAPTVSETTGLTGRQVDVLRLIASGHSNLEIARRLFVTINSVKTYIRSAYRTIGVTNRSQAVVWATDNGLGPLEVPRTALAGVAVGRVAP